MADHAELLAAHYRRARELGQASGTQPDVDELKRREARFLALAGDRARNLDAERAERLYRNALQLGPGGLQQRAELLLKIVQVAPATLGAADILDLAREAVASYRQLGDEHLTAMAMVSLSRCLWVRGDTQGAQTEAMNALKLLGERTPGKELVNAYVSVAGLAMTAGRGEEAVRWAGEGPPRRRDPWVGRRQGPGAPIPRHSALHAGRSDGDRRPSRVARARPRIGRRRRDRPCLHEPGRSVVRLGRASPVACPLRPGHRVRRAPGAIGHCVVDEGRASVALFSMGRWDELMATTEQYDGDAQIDVLVQGYRAYVLTLRGALAEATALMKLILPRARDRGRAGRCSHARGRVYARAGSG